MWAKKLQEIDYHFHALNTAKTSHFVSKPKLYCTLFTQLLFCLGMTQPNSVHQKYRRRGTTNAQSANKQRLHKNAVRDIPTSNTGNTVLRLPGFQIAQPYFFHHVLRDCKRRLHRSFTEKPKTILCNTFTQQFMLVSSSVQFLFSNALVGFLEFQVLLTGGVVCSSSVASVNKES